MGGEPNNDDALMNELRGTLSKAGSSVRSLFPVIERHSQSATTKLHKKIERVKEFAQESAAATVWSPTRGSAWLQTICNDMRVCIEDAQNDACTQIDDAISRYEDRVDNQNENLPDVVSTLVEECLEALGFLAEELESGQNDLSTALQKITDTQTARLQTVMQLIDRSMQRTAVQTRRHCTAILIRVEETLKRHATSIRNAVVKVYLTPFLKTLKEEGVNPESQKARDRWTLLLKQPTLQTELDGLREVFLKFCTDNLTSKLLPHSLYSEAAVRDFELQNYKAIVLVARTTSQGLQEEVRSNVATVERVVAELKRNLCESARDILNPQDDDDEGVNLMVEVDQLKRSIEERATAIGKKVNTRFGASFAATVDALVKQLDALAQHAKTMFVHTEQVIKGAMEDLRRGLNKAVETALAQFDAEPPFMLRGEDERIKGEQEAAANDTESWSTDSESLVAAVDDTTTRRTTAATSRNKSLVNADKNNSKTKNKSSSSDDDDGDDDDNDDDDDDDDDSSNDDDNAADGGNTSDDNRRKDQSALVFQDDDENALGQITATDMDDLMRIKSGQRVNVATRGRRNDIQNGYLVDLGDLHPSDTSDEEAVNVSKTASKSAVKRLTSIVESAKQKADELRALHGEWKGIHEALRLHKDIVDGMIDEFWDERTGTTRQKRRKTDYLEDTVANNVLEIAREDDELRAKTGIEVLNEAVADVDLAMEDLHTWDLDHETALRLFQSFTDELWREVTQGLEGVRQTFAALKSQHHLDLRQLKDAKRGIRVHGSVVDVDDMVRVGESSMPINSARTKILDLRERLDLLKGDMHEQLGRLKEDQQQLTTMELQSRLYLLRLLRQYSSMFQIPKNQVDQISNRCDQVLAAFEEVQTPKSYSTNEKRFFASKAREPEPKPRKKVAPHPTNIEDNKPTSKAGQKTTPAQANTVPSKQRSKISAPKSSSSSDDDDATTGNSHEHGTGVWSTDDESAKNRRPDDRNISEGSSDHSGDSGDDEDESESEAARARMEVRGQIAPQRAPQAHTHHVAVSLRTEPREKGLKGLRSRIIKRFARKKLDLIDDEDESVPPSELSRPKNSEDTPVMLSDSDDENKKATSSKSRKQRDRASSDSSDSSDLLDIESSSEDEKPKKKSIKSKGSKHKSKPRKKQSFGQALLEKTLKWSQETAGT